MKVKGFKNSLAALLLVTAMVMGLFAPAQFAEAAAGVKINSGNFPDTQLRKAVKKLDKNKDGKLSTAEAKKVKYVYLYNNGIKDIYIDGGLFSVQGVKKAKGVEYLTSALEIYLDSTKDKSYDFTKLSKLNYLKIGYNSNMTSLKVNGLKKLETLCVTGCSSIKSIDISKCTGIKEANVDGCNAFTNLKTSSKNTKLVGLYLYMDKVSKIDLTNLKNLKTLNVSYNDYLKTIDFKSLTKLESLNISGHEWGFKSLDVSAMSNLSYLDFHSTNISELTLPASNKLSWLYAYGASITSVDMSANTSDYCTIWVNPDVTVTLPNDTYTYEGYGYDSSGEWTSDVMFSTSNVFTGKALSDEVRTKLTEDYDQTSFYFTGENTGHTYTLWCD